MALFGLVTKSDYTKLQQEMEALKANFKPYERWQLETARSEMYNLPDPSIYANQASLYRRLPAFFQGIDIVSSSAALTDFNVARLVKGKEPKDLPGHDFELRLNNPNPLDSRYEFLYATVAYYKLTKNSYWWLNRKNENVPPDEMWTIAPHMIEPIPDGNKFLRGYIYRPGNGLEIFFEPHEIIHFRGFNPFSSFVGLSAGVESLALMAQAYLGMVDWQARLYKDNNARLPSMITFEQMIADPTWEDIKANTREAARNREMLMLRGVGQGGVQWIQNTSNQKDMEFIPMLDATDKKILDTIAPGAYTMLYENANEANSRTGKAILNDLAVYPMHVMMAQKITTGILSSYPGRDLIGRFKDTRVTDQQLKLQEIQEYAKTHTINQINEKYYQGDEIFEDERGDLIPVQLNPQSGGLQEPQPALNQTEENKPMTEGEKELDAAENKPPKDKAAEKETEAESTKRAMFEALSKYERYALRKIGKPLDFTNDILPAGMIREIAGAVKSCKDETDVRTVFTKYKAGYTGRVEPINDAAMVLEGIRLALAKL